MIIQFEDRFSHDEDNEIDLDTESATSEELADALIRIHAAYTKLDALDDKRSAALQYDGLDTVTTEKNARLVIDDLELATEGWNRMLAEHRETVARENA